MCRDVRLNGTVVFDARYEITLDNGTTWVEATLDNFPSTGIPVIFPYPPGTDRFNYTFCVVHMFSVTSQRLGTIAGQIESPEVTPMEDGLHVMLRGMSPVAISWEKKSQATHTDIMFRGTVKFLNSGSHPEPKLMLWKNGTSLHKTVASQVDADTWTYLGEDLSYGSDYYALLDPIPDYMIFYRNVGGYASVTDLLYDGGTAEIVYIPHTGNKSNMMLYTILVLVSMIGFVVLSRKQRV